MKKSILVLAITIISFFSFSQSFNGVAISGSMQTAVNGFKAKGFVVVDAMKDVTLMKGKIQSQPVELYIKVTPKTKQVCSFSMYFSKHISWSGIQSEYDKYKTILTDKYGEPTNEYDFFSKPYFLGDGYELQALRMEKCTYATYWFDKDNMNIAIEMSKFEQINITYENEKLMQIRRKELDDQNKTIF